MNMMHRFLNTGGGLYKSKLAYLRLAVPVLAFLFVSSLLTASISTPAFNADAANPTLVSASVIRPAFALTLSVSPSVTLNLEPTPTGVMSVVSSTVSAATTSPSGYRLYLEMTGANSTDNSLIHTTDNNKKFTSSGTLESPVALANGTWGYAIAHSASSVNSDNGFDASYTTMASGTPTENKFAAVPASPSPAQRIAETDYVGGIDLTVFYGARADYTTASGAYTNKVLYTALADNSDTHTMIVSPTTILPSGSESISLTTSLYSTAGEIASDAYLLTAEQYAAVTAAQNPTPVSTYSSQKMTCQRDTNSDPLKLDCTTVEVDAGSGYVYLDVPGYGEHFATEITVYDPTPTMQNFTVAECTAMDTGDAITLKDSRDGNEYVVRKLADGNCWMTENLRLVGDGQTALTPDDSDVLDSSFVLTASDNSTWCTTNSAECFDKSMVYYDNTKPVNGAYYNWYAATAGTTSYSMPNAGIAASSVCPKGWRLPVNGSSGEYKDLYDNYYNSFSLMTDTNGPHLTLAGYRSGSGVGGLTDGYYWTSGVGSSISGGSIYLKGASSTIYANYSNARSWGLNVRCVLERRTLTDIRYMQEMSPQIVANTSTDTSKVISDTRGSAYRTKKLADGNIWMTQNLRLVGSKKLTSADSNVSSDYTLPASSTSGWCTDATATCYNKQNVLDSGNTTYGVYYSWAAATAGTGTSDITSGSDATSSICPKGWRLPTGGSSGEFNTLYEQYNTSALMQDATNGPGFVLSGIRIGSSTERQGSGGSYWSSTANGFGSASRLFLNNSGVNFVGDVKYGGFTVRCIAQ